MGFAVFGEKEPRSGQGSDDQGSSSSRAGRVYVTMMEPSPWMSARRHSPSFVTASSLSSGIHSTASPTGTLTPTSSTAEVTRALRPLTPVTSSPWFSATRIPEVPPSRSLVAHRTESPAVSAVHAHAVPTTDSPVATLKSSHEPLHMERVGVGGSCPVICPKVDTTDASTSHTAVSAASSSASSRKSSNALPCPRTGLIASTPTIRDPSRRTRGEAANYLTSNAEAHLMFKSATPATKEAGIPFTPSSDNLSRPGTAKPYALSTLEVPITRGLFAREKFGELTSAASHKICEYYTVGDADGIPVEVIIDDGMKPGSYLMEDERYLSDVPAISPREFVTQCILHGVEPIVSFTAGRGSRLVEVVIPDGPEPRRYLWEERVLLKSEKYTASGRTATKVNIRRMVNLSKEMLKHGVGSGASHYPSTAVYCRQIFRNEEEATCSNCTGASS